MKVRHLLILACAISISTMFGCAGMHEAGGEAAKAKVTYNLAPEVKVTKLDYYLDKKCKISKKACLTIALTLKNTSSKPLRYITRVTLPEEGKSVGGFVPRKGTKDKKTGKKMPPAIAAGESKTVKYPLFHYEQPKNIEVQVTVYE
jgi:hypothetical protein